MTSLMEGNIPYEWKRLFIWSAWRPQLWIWYHPMEADTRFFGCARHRSSLQYRAREPVFYLTGNKTCSQQSVSISLHWQVIWFFQYSFMVIIFRLSIVHVSRIRHQYWTDLEKKGGWISPTLVICCMLLYCFAETVIYHP